MEARELRIGNLVEYPNWNNDGSPAYFKIRDIYTDDNKIGLTNGIIQVPSTKLDYIIPVLLTREWLDRFGFYSEIIHESDTAIYVLKDLSFYIDYYSLQPIDSGFPIVKYKIKYVHQLQNLYFSLTGEELIIKDY